MTNHNALSPHITFENTVCGGSVGGKSKASASHIQLPGCQFVTSVKSKIELQITGNSFSLANSFLVFQAQLKWYHFQ
jgi:hypothetical protein